MNLRGAAEMKEAMQINKTKENSDLIVNILVKFNSSLRCCSGDYVQLSTGGEVRLTPVVYKASQYIDLLRLDICQQLTNPDKRKRPWQIRKKG